MEKKNGCCHDEVKVVKMATDHLLGKTISPSFSSLLSVPVLYLPITAEYLQNQPAVVDYTRPPPLSGRSLLIEISLFRI